MGKKRTLIVIMAVAVATVAALSVAVLPGRQRAGATKLTATCTNSIADSTTINATIAGSQTGDEIVFDGPCLITDTIKLIGERSYRGESRTGTVLKQADSANLKAILASDTYVDNDDFTGGPLSVRQLALDGNKDNGNTNTNCLVVRSWQSVVEDLEISNCGKSGLLVPNESEDGTELINTQVNGRIAGNFIQNSGSHGINVQDGGNSVTDWNLLDNWVAESGGDGIHLDNTAGWTVERNHIYGVQKHAINAARVFGSSISDNYIEDFGRSTTGSPWYGIAASVQGDAATTIANNRVFNFGGERAGAVYRYIAITQVNYGSGYVAVTGNTVRAPGASGSNAGLYYVKGGGAGLTVSSTGNNVTGVSTQRLVGGGVTMNAGL